LDIDTGIRRILRRAHLAHTRCPDEIDLPGVHDEDFSQLFVGSVSAVGLHQQQQSAAAGEEYDRRRSAEFRDHGHLSGWHEATLLTAHLGKPAAVSSDDATSVVGAERMDTLGAPEDACSRSSRRTCLHNCEAKITPALRTRRPPALSTSAAHVLHVWSAE